MNARRRRPWLLLLPVLFFSFSVFLSSCQEEKIRTSEEYNGPVTELDNIVMLYSDSARLVIKMTTPKRLEMPNGEQIFPKEVNLFFYDRTGRETSTLRSDSGRYYPVQNLFKVKGNVVVNQKVKNEILKTDELTWERDTKKIFTAKPVTITTPTQQIRGLGLDTDQNFMNYKMRKVTGSVSVSNLP